ncbi:single-stranded DNA-binding protein [Ilyomonas limi]|uniref:Single-stranded DNA-binding protein n=1 Tax=Ilyomonas limi TaxID=2575867 RepID=A0A4U3KV64_9BACT|nr:single-stranded DNA-binding protein [Ilyomonas limi]TKK66358.1 single-stranded DNA-binding protein [Ilyomonas limi]
MELTGRLTADAVIKALPDERQVVNFSIAINDYHRPKGAAEGKEFTLYVSCSYWKSTGVAAKLLKGTIVEVSGRMYIRAYIGTDNEPKASLNLHCNSIKVHGSSSKKQHGNSEEAKPEAPVENMVAQMEPEDDIPF